MSKKIIRNIAFFVILTMSLTAGCTKQLSSESCFAPNKSDKKVGTIDLVTFEPVISARGVEYGILRMPTLAYLEVIERSPNVKSVTQITMNEDKNLHVGAPVLSHDGKTLFYRIFETDSTGDSYSSIWKKTIGSTGQTRVTYGRWIDTYPALTSEDEYLIFSSNRSSNNPTLWRISVGKKGGITKITDSLAHDTKSSISPDNDFIVYSSQPPNAHTQQIWSITMEGSMPTQLREGMAPDISPDGKKIVFTRSSTGKNKTMQIWVMNTDGSEETQLTQNSEYNVLQPKWSPDGKWIVYASNEGLNSMKKRNYDIWIMDSNGGKKTQITTNGSLDDNPYWDPSGKFIYFRSNRKVEWNIWRLEISQLPG